MDWLRRKPPWVRMLLSSRRALADQMGEDLALLLAGEIGARRGGGEVELRCVARVLGHGAL